jgi:hypothetical protein
MGLIFLGILKFVGLGISAISTIWGLTQRTTYDDETGHKRLTRAGQMSIALAIGGALVATTSLGFETIANLTKEAEGERAKGVAAKALADAAITKALEMKAVEKDRELATQRHDLESQQAEINATRTQLGLDRQAALQLQVAHAARLRDLGLANSVNRESERNLARTGDALTQIERVVQRINTLVIQVDWELRGTASGAATANALVRDLARRVRAGEPAALSAADIPAMLQENAAKVQTFAIRQTSPYFPLSTTNRPLAAALQPYGRVSLFAAGAFGQHGMAEIVAEPVSAASPIYRHGDLRMELSRKEGTYFFYYEITPDTLWFETETRLTPTTTSTNVIVSLPDLENSSLVLDMAAGSRPTTGIYELARQLRLQVRPRRILIRANGKTYTIKPDRIEEFRTATGYPLFVVGPIGPPN